MTIPGQELVKFSFEKAFMKILPMVSVMGFNFTKKAVVSVFTNKFVTGIIVNYVAAGVMKASYKGVMFTARAAVKMVNFSSIFNFGSRLIASSLGLDTLLKRFEFMEIAKQLPKSVSDAVSSKGLEQALVLAKNTSPQSVINKISNASNDLAINVAQRAAENVGLKAVKAAELLPQVQSVIKSSSHWYDPITTILGYGAAPFVYVGGSMLAHPIITVTFLGTIVALGSIFYVPIVFTIHQIAHKTEVENVISTPQAAYITFTMGLGSLISYLKFWGKAKVNSVDTNYDKALIESLPEDVRKQILEYGNFEKNIRPTIDYTQEIVLATPDLPSGYTKEEVMELYYKMEPANVVTELLPETDITSHEYELSMLGNNDFSLLDPINKGLLRNIILFEQEVPANTTEENLRTLISSYIVYGKEVSHLIKRLPLNENNCIVIERPGTAELFSIPFEKIENFKSLNAFPENSIPEHLETAFFDNLFSNE